MNYPVFQGKGDADPATPRCDPLSKLVGCSEAMLVLKQRIRKVAEMHLPVLLVGESGTGKELVARALHELSARCNGPYIAINAAAVPSGLVESEFFGHESGAYTGADRKGRAGKFELAHRGTLFLDEVGDMPLDVQPKLLRVLEDGWIERLGGRHHVQTDFRLVCASHRDITTMQMAGRFRHDLYYRISAITLELPPLRDRLEDIPLLVQVAMRRFFARHGGAMPSVHPSTIAHLRSMSWPGNVRQLCHQVERAIVFCEDGCLMPRDFPDLCDGGLSQRVESLAEVETKVIRATMERLGGNKKQVAQALGISRSYLYKRLAS